MAALEDSGESLTSLDRKLVVRQCLEAFQRLVSAAGARDRPAIVPDAARAVLDGIERLVAMGCEIEARFLCELRDRLRQLPLLRDEAKLLRDFDDAIARLAGLPWLPEAPLDPKTAGQQPRVRVYFVRHGESTGNVEKCLQGSRIQGALTPRGHAQSRRTADYLSEAFEDLRNGDALLVSSPARRAMETAKPIRERLACPLLTDPGLAELDFGDWSGRYFAELESDTEYQEWMKDNWFKSAPAGESLFEVRTRICQALSSLLSRAIASNTSLVIVTHFFPLMAIFSALIPGQIARCDNSSITCFQFASGDWNTALMNYISHLGDDVPTPVGYV
jgi:probable phosphoglycerate mutase